MSKTVIEMHDIVKTYYIGTPNELEVLHGISLEIHEGEFVSIVGASGSGKSTLMNIIGALDHQTSGEYTLDGVPMTEMNSRKLSQILADEPTGALDSNTGRLVMDIFHELHKKQGKTIILITHNNELAEETERIITIHDGRIVQERDKRTGKQEVQHESV